MQQISPTTPSTASVWVDKGRVHVGQKGCGISKSMPIVTGSFGPCYVLVGADPITKYCFLAHIDVYTDMGSVRQIFSTLKTLGVATERLTGLQLLGGWKTHTESAAWGDKLIAVLKEEGIFEKVNFEHYQTKRAPVDGEDPNEKTHYHGGQLTLEKNFCLFKERWARMEEGQVARIYAEVDQILRDNGYAPERMLDYKRMDKALELMIASPFPLWVKEC